jgi:hypothetical protein
MAPKYGKLGASVGEDLANALTGEAAVLGAVVGQEVGNFLDEDDQKGQGRKRPNQPPQDNAGVRVTLTAKPGLTRKGHLESPYHFQCPPLDSISWEGSFDHEEYQTLTRGTFSRAAGRGLRTVTFSTLVADFNANERSLRRHGSALRKSQMNWFRRTGRTEAHHLAEELRKLMNAGTPFWLRVGMPKFRPDWDIKMLATLRSLQVEERAGEPESRYLNIAFSEYRPTDDETSRKAKGPRGDVRVVTLRIDDEKKVIDGGGIHGLSNRDSLTLVRVAIAAYGAASYWQRIRDANDIKWGGHEDLFDYMERKKIKRLRLRIPVVMEAKSEGLLHIPPSTQYDSDVQEGDFGF